MSILQILQDRYIGERIALRLINGRDYARLWNAQYDEKKNCIIDKIVQISFRYGEAVFFTLDGYAVRATVNEDIDKAIQP